MLNIMINKIMKCHFLYGNIIVFSLFFPSSKKENKRKDSTKGNSKFLLTDMTLSQGLS